MKIKVNTEVKAIARVIGAPCYVVGGAVIDGVRGIPNIDYDIEVFGLSYKEIQTKLENAGYKCNLTGKAWGVSQVTQCNDEFDRSGPRTENKLGVGHAEFEVSLESNMSPEQAAIRRGLTIEALMANIETGEVLDPNNGLNDLEGQILRMNNPITFDEDPLRVLRIAQNLSRGRGKVVEYLTLQRCKTMTPEHLSRERIWDEWKKILMGDKPSRALEFLEMAGWMKYWPEVHALQGVYQRPDYHAEGDVWTHTLLVVDEAAKLRNNIPEDLQLDYMVAALLHDVGKPSTTNANGQALGHEKAGVEPAKTFMARMTSQDFPLVWKAIECHLQPFQLEKEGKKSAYKRLHNKIRLDFIGYLSYADHKGRITMKKDEKGENALDKCLIYFREFGNDPIPPHIMGRDLIALGWNPGKYFKDVLDRAYEYQIEDGLSKEELLELLPKWMELS